MILSACGGPIRAMAEFLYWSNACAGQIHLLSNARAARTPALVFRTVHILLSARARGRRRPERTLRSWRGWCSRRSGWPAASPTSGTSPRPGPDRPGPACTAHRHFPARHLPPARPSTSHAARRRRMDRALRPGPARLEWGRIRPVTAVPAAFARPGPRRGPFRLPSHPVCGSVSDPR